MELKEGLRVRMNASPQDIEERNHAWIAGADLWGGQVWNGTLGTIQKAPRWWVTYSRTGQSVREKCFQIVWDGVTPKEGYFFLIEQFQQHPGPCSWLEVVE
jgi:hypothetical protein